MFVTDGKSRMEFLSTETLFKRLVNILKTMIAACQIDFFFEKLREKFVVQVLCKCCCKIASFFP